MTYGDFVLKYNEYFERMMQYSPDQVGARWYAEKMAALAEEYPEFEERLEKELGV